jgi:ABC-type multidrug transport system ATPase subunit/ABC-type multidrug transport system permease subunit
MICDHCGTHNPSEARNCVGCGRALEREANLPEDTRHGARALTPALPTGMAAPHGAAAPPTVSTAPPINTPRKRKKRRSTANEMPSATTLSEDSVPAPEAVDGLPEGARRLTFGFDPDNDIVIPMHAVSSHHAVLARDGSRYLLADLDSTNGTTVNGHAIACARVYPGDRIGFGSYSFTLDTELVERLADEGAQQLRATQALSAIPSELAEFARTTTVVIGRDPECDIVLDAPQISRRHVKLTRRREGGWLVEDLGSANGTYLRDRHTHRVERGVVEDRDVIFMGSYRFPISRLRDFLGDLDAPQQQTQGNLAMSLDKKIITIGRGSDNDIVLDAPQVSRHHARILRKNKAFFLEDLASANGTFINGKRVGRAELGPEDTVSFGTYAVRIDLARGAIQKSYRGDILLQAENIRVDVVNNGQPKRLLDGVSFTAYPTEFVGVMGPSGAGKTTLLMSMIGYLRPTFGRTVINGDELSTHYDRYRGAIGYVPQEDIIHGELTVYEALYFTAKLRLPPDTDDAEIARRIDQVLVDLEIAPTRDVRIGSPERKGISGGQRKRVNLALELLTEPSLLCLDEPTSGLASEDAANVMRLLRKLADQGRTILITIHQPSLQVYRKLDNVLYLADGEEVYYGPTYPDSMLYFHPNINPSSPQAQEILSDPGSCLRPLVDAKRAGEPMETFAARYRQSTYYKEYVEDRRENRGEVDITGGSGRKSPSFQLHQLVTLCRRYLTIKRKDTVGTAILLAQAPIIGLLVNMVFAGLDTGAMNRLEFMPFALFILIISAIWFGCSNSAREIVSEQAIYKRERMVNLSILAYVGSKFVVLAALSLGQCVMLLAMTYFMLDMVGNPLYHLVTLWMCALAGTSLGLLLSAFVRTTPAALALVPLLLIPQVILGGAIMPIARMETPSWLASQTMISRWGFEAALHAEHLNDAYEIPADELPKPFAPGLPAPPPPPNPLDRFFGEEAETWLAVDLGALGGFIVLTLVLTGGVIRGREHLEG